MNVHLIQALSIEVADANGKSIVIHDSKSLSSIDKMSPF